jgi:tetratricopeptide (TPR) repeat protein
MSSGIHVDNRGATIGQQVVAGRVFFGGEEPSQREREELRQWIATRHAAATRHGALAPDDALEIDAALRRLLGARGEWKQATGCGIASIEVTAEAWEQLLLPFELLRPPPEHAPAIVRCEVGGTTTVPEAPQPRPEGGRVVLATAELGEPVAVTVLDALWRACDAGMHLASGSERDRKRGAFDHALDYLPWVSRHRLHEALGPSGDRPGAAVLMLVCRVSSGGLRLHEDGGGEAIVGAEAFAATLAPFSSHLRLVVLAVAAQPAVADAGRAIVEVATALHRRGVAAVVAPRVPLPGAALPRLTTTLFGSLLGNAQVPPTSLEAALARVDDRPGTEGGLASPGLRLYARATDGDDTRPFVIRPYRGLLSFGPEHARFYLGREPEVDEVVRRLAELAVSELPRLLLLVGASGVGKSSLAKAGVVPRLSRDGWAPLLTRPTQHTVEQLDALLAGVASVRRLLVVDQLEEVFMGSGPAAGAYLPRLWAMAAAAGTAVIATLRIDALDLGGEVTLDATGRTLEQLVPGLHAMFVHHLQANALERVITEPARNVGLELDPGLVDQLCTEALAEPGALPMLELVLDRLWSHRRGRRMVASAYEGGLAATLATHADACVDALPGPQRAQAKRILVRLATGSVELASSRRRAKVEALQPERPERRAAFEAALAALVEARLVVRGSALDDHPNGDASNPLATAVETVELAHDLLLRRWDALHAWIEAAAPRLPAIRDLEQWVEEWSERRTLLTPEQLTYIEQAALSADDDDLNGRMLELIAASRRAVSRARRLRRVRFAAVVAVAVAFAGLSQWALAQRDLAQERTRTAEDEQDNADEQARIARQERSAALEQTALAEEQTRLAGERLYQAVAVANEIIDDVLPRLEPYPQVSKVRLEILDSMQRTLARLDPNDGDFQAHVEIASAHFKRAGEALRANDVDVARAEYEATYTTANKLYETRPDRQDVQDLLIGSLSVLGRLDKSAGKLAAAHARFQRVRDLRELRANENPRSVDAKAAVIESVLEMSMLERRMGNLAAARDSYRRGLELVEALADGRRRDALAQEKLAASFHRLGQVDEDARDLASARDHYRRALDIREALANASPLDAEVQSSFGHTLDVLGGLEEKAGNLLTARGLYRRSLAVIEALANAAPSDAGAQHRLCSSLHQLGQVEALTNELAAARDVYQRALAIAEALVEAAPHDDAAQRKLRHSLVYLGKLEVLAGDVAAARGFYQRELVLCEAQAKAHPDAPGLQRELVMALIRLGDLEVPDGDLVVARDYLRRALDVREAVPDLDDPTAQRDLCTILEKLGDVMRRGNNLADARVLLGRAVERREALANADSHDLEAQRHLSNALEKLGDVERDARDFAAARALNQRALELRKALASAAPDDAQASLDVVIAFVRCALEAEESGDRVALREAAEAAQAHLIKMEAKGQVAGTQPQRDAIRSIIRRGLDKGGG